ncbi:MAG: radical SAM protein [Acidobacteria bacterium]|nr:radical SAM protein [Acidobacteriota bacterium]
MTENRNLPTSTVYGPVQSWRVGKSLGIDLLYVNSICSFRCVYCQLGKINDHTLGRKIYAPTKKVIADLKASLWQEADVITFSGNGEPTLAANLGEVIQQIKAFTGKPIVVLTNATTLNNPAVRNDLQGADKIFCKLDAATDRTLQLIDRPVAGITIRSIVEGIKTLRKEYAGHLAIQTMLLPVNENEAIALAALLNEIRPDEVQLNTPSRPVPREWIFESRGNHEASFDNAAKLRMPTQEKLAEIEQQLRQLTGLEIITKRS